MGESSLRLWRFFLFAPVLALLHGPAAAIEPVFAADGAAIRGYDPVAYFTLGEPTEGDPSITHDYMGASWRFTSTGHRDLFAANPEKYAPQYGGYCSWAASRDYVATTNPKAWEIVDDKLYLNFSLPVHTLWRIKKRENISKADANWPDLLASD